MLKKQSDIFKNLQNIFIKNFGLIVKYSLAIPGILCINKENTSHYKRVMNKR